VAYSTQRQQTQLLLVHVKLFLVSGQKATFTFSIATAQAKGEATFSFSYASHPFLLAENCKRGKSRKIIEKAKGEAIEEKCAFALAPFLVTEAPLLLLKKKKK
jgi:hypothetical protein